VKHLQSSSSINNVCLSRSMGCLGYLS